ncbi:MAG: tRNA (adenosine(37)-N6)-threonylcarbamoyltransferase complex ATPase subunit type 1 TsaE [Clostridia bacterium]|nr:tRNA (adenosine(37)-N6)-threonylcarbamoyltransferase complex ATPase subunit type 1 TsaE [Clostridia bacterium]
MMEFYSKSDMETRSIAEGFAKNLKAGDVVCLTGDLGAGKTTFTKGIATALQVPYEPTSPTFNIVNVYEGNTDLYHFDLYRLQETEDLYSIDFDSYLFGDGILVIEWPEIAYPLLDKYYSVHLTYDGENRKIEITEV